MAPAPRPDAGRFLQLLLDDAPASAYDAVLEQAGPEPPGELGEAHARALQLREEHTRQRQREAELSALYETAQDLTALRDLDAVLTAIVRRARQLLRADMTYLSLNDEVEGASYMKVTDGALTAEFRTLRLPLGTGLLGLVAQTGAPYFTEDYQSDERFVHRGYIDDAVAGEQIRAILGVPLMVDGRVIGALLAVHRTVRPFPAGEVALLSSFAAHAAVALENARLFERAREANEQLRQRSEATERAAHAHDLLTDALLHGGGVAAVADVLAQVLGGAVTVLDADGRRLCGPEVRADVSATLAEARASGRSVPRPGRPHRWVAAAAAGEEHLGTLVLRADELSLPERRTLERGALVTALVLLFGRVEAEAAERVRGELLDDLVAGRETDPARLRDRGARQGARLDGPFVVLVGLVERAEDLHPRSRQVGRIARERHGLGGGHEGRLVLVLPGGDARAVADEVAGRVAGTVTWGAADVAEAAALVPAYAEATRVAEALIALGRAGEVSDPAGLGVTRLLLAGQPDGAFEEFLAATIGPLRDYDAARGTALCDTVEAWLDAGGSLVRAAEGLHVHPNTVGQRLERVTALLGDDWRSPTRSLDLRLALRMLRLRHV